MENIEIFNRILSNEEYKFIKSIIDKFSDVYPMKELMKALFRYGSACNQRNASSDMLERLINIITVSPLYFGIIDHVHLKSDAVTSGMHGQDFIDHPYLGFIPNAPTIERKQFESMSVEAQTEAIERGVIINGRFRVSHSQSYSITDSVKESCNINFDNASQRFKIADQVYAHTTLVTHINTSKRITVI